MPSHNRLVNDLQAHIFGGAFDLFHCTPAKDQLFKIVDLRHDCVHRNGFNKDGQKHEVFTKGYVQDSADLIKNFVEKIDEQVKASPS